MQQPIMAPGSHSLPRALNHQPPPPPPLPQGQQHQLSALPLTSANGAGGTVTIGGGGLIGPAERRVCFPGDGEEWRSVTTTANKIPREPSPSIRKNGTPGMALGDSLARHEWTRGGLTTSSPGAVASGGSGGGSTAAAALGVRGGCGDWSDGLSSPKCAGFRVGIYGWRKRCLYLLVLSLMVMVIVNLALTLWLLKVMEFSSEGMGQLRIVAGGIQLNGQAMILDSLVASSIRSRRGQPIAIESSRNFSVNTRDDDGRIINRLFLGEDRFEVQARRFRVVDPRGSNIFTADQREVVVGAEVLRVTGAGGAVFDGTVQTPLVRADSGFDLRLESPTRSLEVKAPLGVAIESRAGDISATCLTDLKLQSVAGAVRLDSANIMLPTLKTANVSPTSYGPPPAPPSDTSGAPRRSAPEVFQLCICGNGKLFLAPPDGICVADNDVCR
ncbi:delta-sarcoglycan-like [Ischnura elegans]|uniref:delta-sarcoglycan-like n=1 Tax=Ischnura elegans TaxID=197161 RepID=UPI001ED8A128|nr:delta-sarcoglycan-like [Ischnura elegans]